jgi:hypothetical protein
LYLGTRPSQTPTTLRPASRHPFHSRSVSCQGFWSENSSEAVAERRYCTRRYHSTNCGEGADEDDRHNDGPSAVKRHTIVIAPKRSTNATNSAKVAARKVKDAAHSGAYGVAFGVVFSAVFLVELLPANNVLRRGFEDGAEEGFDAAIAKSAARNSKRRELIESAEETAIPGTP